MITADYSPFGHLGQNGGVIVKQPKVKVYKLKNVP
jgi:hypothetical protein